jgi:hypothetical protein
MGEYEEIVNGPGNDFTVVAQGGDYRVFVANSLDIAFELIGTGSGQMGFDLIDTSLDEARYVRIQYLSGDNVELDAIAAIYYNTPLGDADPPTLGAYGDWYQVDLGSSHALLWFAYDETPWSYEIYENSSLVLSEFWNGTVISYLFEPTYVGVWNVTVVAYDAFGNLATNTVMVYVLDPTVPPDTIMIALVVGLAVGASAFALVIIWMKKK